MAAEKEVAARAEEAKVVAKAVAKAVAATVEAGRAEAMVVEATVVEAMAAVKEVAAMVAVVRAAAQAVVRAATWAAMKVAVRVDGAANRSSPRRSRQTRSMMWAHSQPNTSWSWRWPKRGTSRKYWYLAHHGSS